MDYLEDLTAKLAALSGSRTRRDLGRLIPELVELANNEYVAERTRTGLLHLAHQALDPEAPVQDSPDRALATVVVALASSCQTEGHDWADNALLSGSRNSPTTTRACRIYGCQVLKIQDHDAELKPAGPPRYRYPQPQE